MTGRELARQVKVARGKVAVPVVIGDGKYYIYAQKLDLVATLEKMGDRETGMVLEAETGGYYLRELD